MNNWTNDVIITTRREAGIPDADILELINRSYKIWAEHELDGPFLHYTVEDFQQATRQANVFVAIERATGKLLGTHTLQARRREGCVHGSLLAVAPEARGRGIASRMLEREAERVRKAGFKYMRGVTAVNAVWSVNWHLKNGYRIIGYRRDPKENHYTYVFRKQLLPPSLSRPVYSLYGLALFCRLRYLTSYIATRLFKDGRGNMNWLGRLAKRMVRR